MFFYLLAYFPSVLATLIIEGKQHFQQLYNKCCSDFHSSCFLEILKADQWHHSKSLIQEK